MPVKFNESKQHILEFLGKNNVGVLATSDNSSQPHAAAIYLIHDDELNIYFISKAGTQKSRDLQHNTKASIAIYDAATQTTLQANGEVQELKDAAQTNWVFSDVLKVSLEISHADPPVSKLVNGGYQACKFTPSSIRLASYQHPPEGDWQNLFVSA